MPGGGPSAAGRVRSSSSRWHTVIADDADLEAIEFDPPKLDCRYLTGKMDPSVAYATQAEMEQALGDDKQRHCVFGKTGGPYLRSTFLRGEAQFLMDIAGDPALRAGHRRQNGRPSDRRRSGATAALEAVRDGHMDLRRHGRQSRSDVQSRAIRTGALAGLPADDRGL